MVFPRAQGRERGEVGVYVSPWCCVPAGAVDVDAHNVVSDSRYLCSAQPVLEHPGHARASLEEPHAARCIQPEFVSPAPAEEKLDVVPGADEHEDGKHNVQDEEDLVAQAPEP